VAGASPSRVRPDVEVLDAGEQPCSGDAETVSEDGDADHAPLRAGRQHLQLAGLRGLVKHPCKIVGHGFASSEGVFEELYWFGELGPAGRGDLDHPWRSRATILTAASIAASISSSPTSRWVQRRT
jgi:hypothetical protein